MAKNIHTIVFWKADVMTISNIFLKINIVLHFIFYDRVNAKLHQH